MTTAYKPLPGADLNDVFITGSTQSTDFPVLSSSSTQLSGLQDAFVIKMAGNSYNRNWVTFYGGSKDQHGTEGKGTTTGFAVAYSNNGTVWFGGRSNCSDLPRTLDDPPGGPVIFIGTVITPPQALKGFVARLNGFNGTWEYGTFFGSGDEVGLLSRVNSIDVNSAGHVFFGGFSLTGLSEGELKNNNTFYEDPEGNGESFIAELDANSQLIWSTEFGQASSTLVDLDVDYSDDLIITGLAEFVSGDMLDFEEQTGVADLSITTAGGGLSTDAYIAKFDISSNDRELIWSTLFLVPAMIIRKK